MDDAATSLRYLDRKRPDEAGGPVRLRTLVRPAPVQREVGWVLGGLDEESGETVEVPVGAVVEWSRPSLASGLSPAPGPSAGPASGQGPAVPGIYRHYKGRYYWLLDVATHSETEERLAVYRCLYGDFSLWVRPLAMFTEQVLVDGVLQPRFAYVGPVAA